MQDQRIRRLDLALGVITTFAGNGEKVRGGDGRPATEASILGARAVCTDGAGNTYIAEREGNGIRKVDANGVMSTLAGTGSLAMAAMAAQPSYQHGAARRPSAATTTATCWWWTPRTTPSAASTPTRGT